MKWQKITFDESFVLKTDDGRYICRLSPKPSRKYVHYLMNKIFEDNQIAIDWYNSNLPAYGSAPKDMKDKEIIAILNRIEYGLF